MGGGLQLQVSSLRKTKHLVVRHIEASDDFDPQSVLNDFVNFPIPSTIEGAICEVPTRDNESRLDAAKRVRDLFYTRTELISRALSGSHVITQEEALNDLREKYEETKDPKLEILLHFPWDRLPVRFRKIVSRSRAKIPTVTQAEITLENPSGVYLFYFNFIPCEICYTSFIRYSYVIAIEEGQLGGFVKIYFALTCPSKDDRALFTFTDNFVKGIAYWVTSGKKPNVNVPLTCVPYNYYTVLDQIRKHPVVLELSEKWPEYEKTDKSKHMFEDVGIVAYLATYWLSTGQNNIRFVDIGCGNGVISYLLNSLYGDAVKGIGYDVKARKIWDFYKSKGVDVLRVQPIVPNFPSFEQPFPQETNYIIGIHTDEMTPWIPLLSMKRRCNFFLLPCCSYDFFGKFVKRKFYANDNPWEYFNYIEQLARTLGYDVKTDALKIPSEKKNAIIGTFPQSGLLLPDVCSDWEAIVKRIMEPSYKANNYRGFRPRVSEIEVRNCTQLPTEVKRSINQSIVNIIRSSNNSEGGTHIKDIVSQLTDEQIAYLKSQHGGLQTFIKNHRSGYILNRPMVHLRTTVYESARLPKTSVYPCFFEQFYPEKCQFRDICGYKHKNSDIVEEKDVSMV